MGDASTGAAGATPVPLAELTGLEVGRYTTRWTLREAIIFALGVGATGADDLPLVYESHGPKVLPMFAERLAGSWTPELVRRAGIDITRLLGGGQGVVVHRPIPVEGTCTSVVRVTAVEDKGRDAVVRTEALLRGDDGEPLATTTAELFLRGYGGFGGGRGPARAPWVPPRPTPDWSVSVATTPTMPLVFRLLSAIEPGRVFPDRIHVDDDFARSLGYEGVILAGISNAGTATLAVTRALCPAEPERLTELWVRYSGVVYPGETLVFSGWRDGDGHVFVADTDTGRSVLRDGRARLTEGTG